MTDTQGGLPIGYTECEYLESNGTQYIDTNVLQINSYDYKIVISTEGTRDGGVFGRRQQHNVDMYDLWLVGTVLYFQYKNQSHGIDINYNVKLEIEKRGDNFYSNDSLKWESGLGTGDYYNQNFLIFTAGYDNSAKVKVYSCKITNNGNEIINLTPCLDMDGVPCMYDSVKRNTLYNLGSGNFGYKTIDGVIVVPT